MMKFEECENHYGACQSGQNAPGITVFLPNQRTKVTLVTKRLMYFICTPNIQNSRNGVPPPPPPEFGRIEALLLADPDS